ncbi:MAG: hypothetical protein HY201_02515 [Nitrospirae bacterium]|nr:hypothetical protein [Candidatus Troglogloeales bacterium]
MLTMKDEKRLVVAEKVMDGTMTRRGLKNTADILFLQYTDILILPGQTKKRVVDIPYRFV